MIELISPDTAYEAEFLAMLEDYRREKEYYGFHDGAQVDFPKYVLRQVDASSEILFSG
jgi:hypothetical protein